MKPLSSTGVFRVVAIALILFSTACKKSSNSGTGSGTVSFQENGTSLTLATNVVDTGNNVLIDAEGTLSGTKDTVAITLEILNAGFNVYAAQLSGVYTDTAAYSPSVDITYGDASTQSYWSDESYKNIFTVDVTSNKSGVMKGTFGGTLYLQTGSSSVDSVIITNGSFSVQL
jgi:hypothetical protein